MGPHLYLYPAGPWEEGAEQETFPGKPKLGLWGRGLQSPEGRHGGVAQARRQERENPPGKHPEWLISADESLFSFRLNTLNRAPSDVYLHSLRANAGGGPGRLQGHSRAGDREKLWAASASTMVGAGGGGQGVVFPRPSPRMLPTWGRGGTFLCSGTGWIRQLGTIMGTVLLWAAPHRHAGLEGVHILQRWHHIVLHISATQQGTGRGEASPWASNRPTLEACLSVVPWQGAARPRSTMASPSVPPGNCYLEHSGSHKTPPKRPFYSQ